VHNAASATRRTGRIVTKPIASLGSMVGFAALYPFYDFSPTAAHVGWPEARSAVPRVHPKLRPCCLWARFALPTLLSPRTTVGAPKSRVIAAPHAAEMTGIGIGRIEYAQARIVGRAKHARGMESDVTPAPAVADSAVMAGMRSRWSGLCRFEHGSRLRRDGRRGHDGWRSRRGRGGRLRRDGWRLHDGRRSRRRRGGRLRRDGRRRLDGGRSGRGRGT
jgi:hypothetical protein